MPRSVYSVVDRGGPSRFNPINLVKRFAVSVMVVALALLGTATMASATSVSTVTFSPSTLVEGQLAVWTVGFTPTASIASGNAGTVSVTFPFAVPSSPTVTYSGMGTCNAGVAATGSGDVVTVTFTVTTSNCSLTAGTAATITIGTASSPTASTNITNPPAGTQALSGFSVATSADVTAVNPTSPSGGFVFTNSAVSGVTFAPATATAGSTSTWTVGFTTSATGALSTASSSTITAMLPTSLLVSSATPVVAFTSGTTGTCTPTAAYTPATGKLVVTFVGSGCAVANSTAVTFTVAGVTNPASGYLDPSGFSLTTSSDLAVVAPTTGVTIGALNTPTAQGAGSGAATVSFYADGTSTTYTVNTQNVTTGSPVSVTNSCVVSAASPAAAGTPESCTVAGLTNGQTYTFTVTPTGNNTTSTVSQASLGLRIGAALATPVAYGAGSNGTTDQASIAFTADGVATFYTVTSTDAGTPADSVVAQACVGNSTTPPTGAQSCTVAGLTNGQTYTFTVTPSGNNTSSTTSLASNSVTTSATTLGAPTAKAASAANSAVVSFGTDGVATLYTVTSSNAQGGVNGICVVQATATFMPTGVQSCTVSGLTSGDTYTFSVLGQGGGTTLTTASGPSNSVTVSNALATPTVSLSASNAATVSWTADGSSTLYTVNTYVVTASTRTLNPSLTCYVANSTTPPTGAQSCTVTGLSAGATYEFTVTPSGSPYSAGTSGYSAPLSTGAAYPHTPSASGAGSGAVKVTFQADGVATTYVVNTYVGAATSASTQTCKVANALTPPTGTQSCIVTGLTDGTTYEFTVTASGGAEAYTAPSAESNATTSGPALATPTVTNAGSGAVTVSFTADGVAAIYTVTATDATTPGNGGQTCVVGNTTTPPTGAQSCTVTGLHNGDVYTFTVTPSGNNTTSGVSAPSAQITVTNVLSTPTVKNAGSGAVAVSFVADGEATVYTVNPWSGGSMLASPVCVVSNTTTPPSGAQTCTVTGLSNGASYTFTVTPSGFTSSTPSAQSAQSASILVGTSFLATPTVVWAASGAIKVSFTADGVASQYTVNATATVIPSSLASTAVTSGTCSVINSVTIPTGAQSCTVSGLTNGVTYTFTVTPSGNGTTSLTSPASAAITASAAIAPATPTAVTSTSTAKSLTVNWTAPASNGSALTGYVVTATAGNTTVSCGTVAGTATSCTISGLVPGTTYALSVSAVNAVGTSAAATASATTSAAPAPVARNPFTTGTHGVAMVGRTVTLTISGGNFFGQPRVTSNAAGVRVGVSHDTGTLLTVIVTTPANSAKGWHTFTLTFANGKVARANYLVK